MLTVDLLKELEGVDPDKTAYRITIHEELESICQSGSLQPSSTIDTRVYRRPEKYIFAFPGKNGLKAWIKNSRGNQDIAYRDGHIVYGLVSNALWHSKDPHNGVVLAFPIDLETATIADYSTIVRREYKNQISDWDYLSSIMPFRGYEGQYRLPELRYILKFSEPAQKQISQKNT